MGFGSIVEALSVENGRQGALLTPLYHGEVEERDAHLYGADWGRGPGEQSSLHKHLQKISEQTPPSGGGAFSYMTTHLQVFSSMKGGSGRTIGL